MEKYPDFINIVCIYDFHLPFQNFDEMKNQVWHNFRTGLNSYWEKSVKTKAHVNSQNFWQTASKMGKAKKLKIAKAPRNTPLESHIEKVIPFHFSPFSVF